MSRKKLDRHSLAYQRASVSSVVSRNYVERRSIEGALGVQNTIGLLNSNHFEHQVVACSKDACRRSLFQSLAQPRQKFTCSVPVVCR